MTYGPPGQDGVPGAPGHPVPGPRPHPTPSPVMPSPYPPPPAAPGRRKRWTSIHLLDAAVLVAGAVIVIFSFFDYYTYEPKGRLRTACSQPGAPKIARELCNGASEGAWSGLFGWLAVVLAVIGAGAVAVAAFAPHVRLPAPGRLIAVGAFGLGVLGTLLALFFVPNYTVDGVVAHGSHYGKFVTEGHGFSYWLIITLQLVGLVAAFVRYQQAGADPGGLSAAEPPSPSPFRPSPFPPASPGGAPDSASPYSAPHHTTPSPYAAPPPGQWSPPPPA